MRSIVRASVLGLGLVLGVTGVAGAQAPAAGSAAAPAPAPAPAGSAAAPAPAGSAATPAAAGDPAAAAPVPVPASAPAPSPADLRKTCVDAMNADETFAKAIVETADKKAAERRLALDLAQHDTAAKAIAKNERHVVIAYIAMWLVAVGFVLFLWRRQQRLNLEIAQLRRDLEAASKDGK